MRPFSLMLFVLVGAGVVLLSGCVSSSTTRPTLTEVERTTRYEISHEMSKRQAYDAIEVELSKAFVSSKTVIDVKQPDNGRIVVKALSQPYVVARGLAGEAINVARLNYMLDIQTENRKTLLEFNIINRDGDMGGYYGGYPTDLSWIRAEFDGIADRLREAVKGSIVGRPGSESPANGAVR